MNFKIEDVPAFYQGYIKKVQSWELLEAMRITGEELLHLGEELSDEKSLYRYDDGKWSIKDQIQHLIDAERVFAYRATRFCRNDQTELSGFEQDHYVLEAIADNRQWKDLLFEFKNLRTANITFFSSLDQEILKRKGTASKVEMSVEMIGYVIAGHTLHHVTIIKEKYLK